MVSSGRSVLGWVWAGGARFGGRSLKRSGTWKRDEDPGSVLVCADSPVRCGSFLRAQPGLKAPGENGKPPTIRTYSIHN